MQVFETCIFSVFLFILHLFEDADITMFTFISLMAYLGVILMFTIESGFTFSLNSSVKA